MRDLLPQVKRRRMFIEGFYRVEVNRTLIERLFLELTEALSMTPITKPMVFSPDARGHPVHRGLAGYMAWVESGVSLYTWKRFKFFTLDIYTCKDFQPRDVLETVEEILKPASMVYEELRYES